MTYSLGNAQTSYDHREPPDWEPESHEMVTCEEAIDHLKAAVRAFGNGKDSAAMCEIENAIWVLMENDSIAALLRGLDLEAVK